MSRASRLAIALALCLSMPLAVGCSSKGADSSDGADSKEEEVVLTDEDVTEVDLTDEKSDKKEESDEKEGTSMTEDQSSKTDASGQRVGKKGIGFVEVPSDWVEFHDVDGNDSIQWCDGTPYTVISLNVFDLSTVPEEERAGFDAMAAANSVWANILSDGVSEDAIQGARVELAGKDAIQVYALYPDCSFLVCWVAEDEDGQIRYVAAEGTEDTIMDAVNIVQDTYEF